ncbi:hypothetical protein B0H11DRAFT_1932770 [Mycena galericulata]|nr:hypothetical protein B0H11DRAFT_1932770 [Mycena galericulata]
MFRAHLGLPTITQYQITEKDIFTTNAAYACWITFLRFQVLDLLISLTYGVTESASPRQPAPEHEGALSLLRALTKWPSRFASVQKLYERRRSEFKCDDKADPQACKSFELIRVLVSTSWPSTLAGKTLKNLHAIGAALKWIIECKANPAKIAGNTKVAHTYVGLSNDERQKLGSLSIVELLRPLAYALNSSPVVAFCNLDLGKSHGHMTRAFLGRLRPPKLAFVEGAVLALIRQVSAGMPLAVALKDHLLPSLLKAPPEISADTGIFNRKSKPPPPTVAALTCVALQVTNSKLPSKSSPPIYEENPPHGGAEVDEEPAATRQHETQATQQHSLEQARVNNTPASRRETWPDAEYVSIFVGSFSSPAGQHEESGIPKKRKTSQKSLGARKKHCTAKNNDPENLHEAEKNPPKRSNIPLVMEAYRPDGFSKRTFSLLLHTVSEHVERPMLIGIQRSMDALDLRHHVPGSIPTTCPTNDEFDLYVIEFDHWKKLSSGELVALWGTGCDIYIRGMRVVGQGINIVERISSLHRLEEPIQVQVPGLRVPVSADDSDDASDDSDGDVHHAGDYTQCIRTTSLRNFLKHASSPDGMVLNALKLPETHTSLPNPLDGSGLDLEDIAYRQTNGLDGFSHECVPAEQQCWQIAGSAHTLTIGHVDMAATRVTVEGPGEKLWIRKKRSGSQTIENAYAFRTWDPDRPDFLTSDYEGVVLPPYGGTLLMQAGTEHIVVGLTPVSESESEGDMATLKPVAKLMATLVTGGHFVVASTIRRSLCTLLHLVMMENILTNVEHDGLWKVFVRISAFWLTMTRDRPQDCLHLGAYIPQLSATTTEGWLDIVSVALVVVLAGPFDRRHYIGSVPPSELKQRQEACRLYKTWRSWFQETFAGMRQGTPINWDRDMFTPMLLHLAIVLTLYHRRERVPNGSDVLLSCDNDALASEVAKTLNSYERGLGVTFKKKLDKHKVEHPSTNFFLFEGPEFQFTNNTYT